ncbi:MAG: DUF3794 domain-containing protein [Clostridia bacterium]|nr:DUF3794 domain-containing protein [Clostridia bacterium]
MEQQKIQVPMLQKTVLTDLSEEFTIPDYQPEIKRILRIEAVAMPADRYVGPGSAEFSGKVEYTLFYLGEDGEIYGAPFEGDYRVLQSVEFPGDAAFDAGILCDADIFTEATTGRLLSPRKFLVKTRLHSEIRLYGERLIEEEFPEGCDCEMLTEETVCARHFLGESEPVRLSDEIPLENGEAPIRVVLCRGKVLVEDATPEEGSLLARGEVVVKLLTVKEGSGERPEAVLRKLPFDVMIPVDGLTPDAMVSVNGCVTDTVVTVEDTRILLDVEMRLFARALGEDRLTYTRDLYALGKESTPTFETLAYPSAIASGFGNFTLSARVPLADAGLAKGQRLEDLTLIPVIEEASGEDGRLTFSGKCRAQAVISSGDEWTTSEFEVPFRYDAGACPKAAIKDIRALADALFCNARKEGDHLALEGEIAVSYTLSGQEEITRAVSLTIGGEIATPASTLRVCYPAPGDTLWSLGKRYGVSRSSLAEANSLSSDSLSGVKFLVV